MKRISVSALIALTCIACGSTDTIAPVTPPFDVSNAVRIPTSALYVEWWNGIERCSGLTGNLNSVTFYVLKGQTTIVVDGQTFTGYWFRPTNSIYLAEPVVTDLKLVWHEMMHALLQDGSHPAKYFNGACGNLLYSQ